MNKRISIAPEQILEIAARLEVLAEQLAGIEPITRLLCDAGDEGDMHNALAAIGGLCDTIFDKLSDEASAMQKLSDEGGVV